MGSLAGHVIPGVFFLIYGLSWCCNSIWLHLTSKRSKESTPTCPRSNHSKVNENMLSQRSWLPLTCCPNFPIEPILKIVFPTIGILIEMFLDYNDGGHGNQIIGIVYHVYDSNGKIREQEKLQHITMHAGFLLSGIIDIVTLFVIFPRQTSSIFLSLALAIECILFYLHTVGRDVFNIHIHMVLVFIVLICFLFSLLRLKLASNVIVNVGFSSCLLLQGTWLIQAGYFLFSSFLPHQLKNVRHQHQHHISNSNHPSSSTTEHHAHSHDHHSVFMFISETFAWHVFLIAIGNVLLWVLLSFIANKTLLHKNASGYRYDISNHVEECSNLIEGTCGQTEDEKISMTDVKTEL